MKQSRKRTLKIAGMVIAVLVVVVTAALGYIGNFFFNYALNPNAETGYMDRTPVAREAWHTANAGDRWLESDDGLQLHAWYAPVEGSHKYVIVCHGYGNEAIGMQTYGEHFYSLGYSVLMPDARASGQSEGQYMGMGWPERRDVVKWAKALVADDPEAEIALFGVSMGGATVMMASGESDLPANVKCVVEDCGYTSVWDEFAGQLKELYGLPPVPVLNAASLVTRLRAGYFLGEASAVKQVEKSVTPTLFIHGDQDDFVPYWMLDVVYEAAACEKEKLVVEGAEHAESRTVAPELYWGTVDAFMAKYMA